MFAKIDLGQFDHGESENHGPETPGSILRAPRPKNLRKGQNFKVIITGALLAKKTGGSKFFLMTGASALLNFFLVENNFEK